MDCIDVMMLVNCACHLDLFSAVPTLSGIQGCRHPHVEQDNLVSNDSSHSNPSTSPIRLRQLRGI